MTKKTKTIIGVVGGLLVIGGIGAATGGKDDKNTSSLSSDSSVVSTVSSVPEVSESNSDTSQAEISEPEQSDTSTYKLNTGELLDVKENDDVLIVKAKIKSQLTDELTIKQNYHNAESIIKSGGDKFKEIQYWAVADSADGEEIKIISFTVPEDVIKGTANGDTVATQYPDLVADLWILPSLLSTTNGESSLTTSTTQSTPQSAPESSSNSTTHFNDYDVPTQQQTTNYVLNTSTKKFHRPSCSDVKKINPENYSTVSSRTDAISSGYSPCGRCKP